MTLKLGPWVLLQCASPLIQRSSTRSSTFKILALWNTFKSAGSYLESLIENEVDEKKIAELEDLSQEAYDKMYDEFKIKLKEKIVYDFKSDIVFD